MMEVDFRLILKTPVLIYTISMNIHSAQRQRPRFAAKRMFKFKAPNFFIPHPILYIFFYSIEILTLFPIILVQVALKEESSNSVKKPNGLLEIDFKDLTKLFEIKLVDQVCYLVSIWRLSLSELHEIVAVICDVLVSIFKPYFSSDPTSRYLLRHI